MNRWKIPKALEIAVIARDQSCVYCGIDFSIEQPVQGQLPSWEHIVNDASLVTLENIARCCRSCNASKGARELQTWLNSAYCLKKGIQVDTVAQVVKNHLKSNDESYDC